MDFYHVSIKGSYTIVESMEFRNIITSGDS